jgi:hypothetical protein
MVDIVFFTDVPLVSCNVDSVGTASLEGGSKTTEGAMMLAKLPKLSMRCL